MTGSRASRVAPRLCESRRAFYLAPHPSTPCEAVRSIEVLVARAPGGGLELLYGVEGDLERIRLPAAASPRRADGLWRHTCFEAFVAREPGPAAPDGRPAAPQRRGPAAAPPPGRAYAELNFAPSGEWAGYEFVGYREGMAPIEGMVVPMITITADAAAGRWRLRASVQVASLLSGAPARLALAAVIEEVNGRLAYWALRHPPGKPDFHHPDGFMVRI